VCSDNWGLDDGNYMLRHISHSQKLGRKYLFYAGKILVCLLFCRTWCNTVPLNKVTMSLCLVCRPWRGMGSGGMAHTFITSAFGGGEWSFSFPSCAAPPRKESICSVLRNDLRIVYLYCSWSKCFLSMNTLHNMNKLFSYCLIFFPLLHRNKFLGYLYNHIIMNIKSSNKNYSSDAHSAYRWASKEGEDLAIP
jgi:hypothetical protein